jgi:hypothetical protein
LEIFKGFPPQIGLILPIEGPESAEGSRKITSNLVVRSEERDLLKPMLVWTRFRVSPTQAPPFKVVKSGYPGS